MGKRSFGGSGNLVLARDFSSVVAGSFTVSRVDVLDINDDGEEGGL